MSKIELPPLPEPSATQMKFGLIPNPTRVVGTTYFTAAQLRAYREQIVEVCAQIAENCSRCHPDDAEMIATAIRNLIEESNNG
jgi:hypothetical protein